MIKAKKGLLITLFAAMMVFAFGATSAFAAQSYTTPDGAVWTNNFQTVTVDGTDYGTTLTQGTNGTIHASFSIVNGRTYNAYFYDLTGAKLFDDNGAAVDAARTFSSYTDNLEKNDVLRVQTQKPEYFTGTWTAYTAAALTNFTTTVATETVTTASKGDTIVIESEVNIAGWSANGTQNRPFLLGDNPKGTVTLTSGSAAATPGWYVDEAKSGNSLSAKGVYDGNEHTVLYYDADAEKVTYEKYNRRTGQWEATETITFKDATTSPYDRYRAQVTKTTIDGSTTTTRTTPAPSQWGTELQISSSAKNPTFGFMWGGNDASTAYDLTKADTSDPSKYVELKTKGEKADAEELMGFFKDLYEIDVKTNVGENIQKWTIGMKTLTADDVIALNKKYETLLTNYGKDDITATDAQFELGTAVYQTAYVLVSEDVNPNVKTDHIYFTNAPNVTYKAKKIKKASKSFTVAAVADSGNAVTFKISSPSKKITINSETGKVTVKKGLKKGTYKVKVYAQTAAGNGYAAAYTYQPAELTIKVKK